MLKKAVEFASKSHEGQFRKGTSIPYISHPLEAAVIASLMTDDEELICATVLHDVVEDAGVSESQLIELFNTRIASLVVLESEDKSKSWQERKATTIQRVKTAELDIKIMTLADKLSNMRSTARDYLLIGDDLWLRFNECRKEKQAWYYIGIVDSLQELSESPYYKEYKALCEKVFK